MSFKLDRDLVKRRAEEVLRELAHIDNKELPQQRVEKEVMLLKTREMVIGRQEDGRTAGEEERSMSFRKDIEGEGRCCYGNMPVGPMTQSPLDVILGWDSENWRRNALALVAISLILSLCVLVIVIFAFEDTVGRVAVFLCVMVVIVALVLVMRFKRAAFRRSMNEVVPVVPGEFSEVRVEARKEALERVLEGMDPGGKPLEQRPRPGTSDQKE